MLSITVAIFNSCVLCYCSKQKKIVGNFSPKKIETKCDIFLFHTNHVRFNRQFPKDNIYIFFWETSNSTNSKADNVLQVNLIFPIQHVGPHGKKKILQAFIGYAPWLALTKKWKDSVPKHRTTYVSVRCKNGSIENFGKMECLLGDVKKFSQIYLQKWPILEGIKMKSLIQESISMRHILLSPYILGK